MPNKNGSAIRLRHKPEKYILPKGEKQQYIGRENPSPAVPYFEITSVNETLIHLNTNRNG
jgi:hypothetical protein